MTMTRKDFDELAAELRAERPRDDAGALPGWRRAVLATARACKERNPAFDQDRFLAATDFFD